MINSSVNKSDAMAEVTGVVNFYSVSDEFGEFSNFALYPFALDGEQWQTSEHYFQSQKFEDKAYKTKIRKSNSPMLAARMGRDRKQKLRRDWESVKVGVMRTAVLAKFTQHEDLRVLLLSTGNSKLVEHTENDDYWGDGGDGSGKNMLGRILMQVRESLRLSQDIEQGAAPDRG
jgi:N-glycosidase YbiA